MGLPIRVAREYTDVSSNESPTSYRAPLNQIGWAKELADHNLKDMPTANNDTLYMSSVIELNEPYIFTVPNTDDRYYVINVFNMWHELEHYIGRRTTGTEEGRYAIVPPHWEGELPEDLVSLNVKTDKVWLWGRLHVKDGEESSELATLQDNFTLRPLSKIDNEGYIEQGRSLTELPSIEGNDLGFYEHLAYAIQANGVREEDRVLFEQFSRIGLTEEGFDICGLPEALVKGLKKGYEHGPYAASSTFASNTMVEFRQGWTAVQGLDDFGYNYPLRALISGPYLGGNGAEEAFYPIRYTDENGDTLNGSNKYILRFNEDLPVNAFWSLSVYNAEDKMLVDNPIGRYKISSDTIGFSMRDDGSFEIPLSHDVVEGEFESNWLPTPEGEFYIIFRLYQPHNS